MAYFTPQEANAWLASTKLSLATLDTALHDHIVELVLSKLAVTFDTTEWTNDATTPDLVRTIMTMYYVSAIYDRTYSDNTDDTTSHYGAMLRRTADQNIAGLIEGSVILKEEPESNTALLTPSFFPNDASSLGLDTSLNPEDTGPAFMMGTVF